MKKDKPTLEGVRAWINGQLRYLNANRDPSKKNFQDGCQYSLELIDEQIDNWEAET